MKQITMQQAADYLEPAAITKTIDAGHAIIHIGISEAGTRLVLVNDACGDSSLTESI